ncbi:hypothetical protein ACIA8I_39390 [Streptomyces rishiriensis]|uniref:hypothetical protein n=1 Tax=Streptomyces rishiriensis TaxID=68264 RepID=UPI0037A6C118
MTDIRLLPADEMRHVRCTHNLTIFETPHTAAVIMAWTWCISSKPSAPPAAVQAAQVRVLADAYGLDATSRYRLIDAALDRRARNARWWYSHLAGPFPRIAADQTVPGRIRWSEQEHAYTSASRKTFDTALG